MEGSDFLILSTIIGNFIGWFLKNKTGFRNELIPAAQLFLSVIKNLLVGAGLLPGEATVLGHFDMAPEIMAAGLITVNIGTIAMSSVVDAALTVGVHSMVKNTKQARKPKARKK